MTARMRGLLSTALDNCHHEGLGYALLVCPALPLLSTWRTKIRTEEVDAY